MKKILPLIKKRWKLLAIVGLAVAGLIYWVITTRANSEEVIVTEKPTIGPLVQSLEVSGVVDAKEKAQLRFAGGGRVVYLGAKEGDYVNRGQTIATIDRAILQKELQYDLNTYEKERLDFDTEAEESKDDHDLTLRDRKELEKNQLDLENSVLTVEMQSLSFRDTWLSAPFSGLLTASPTQVTGVNLLPQDVFELVNPESIVFRAVVDEADISRIKLGLESLIYLDAYPDDEIRTAVEFIAFNSSESTSGTVFVVELSLPAATDLNYFRLGMNGDATIILEEKNNVMSIPLDATIERDDKVFVEIRKPDQTIEEREITIGLETEDRVEVLSGLSPEDDVVIPS